MAPGVQSELCKVFMLMKIVLLTLVLVVCDINSFVPFNITLGRPATTILYFVPDPNTGGMQVKWRPSCFDAGKYHLLFSACDGELCDNETIEVTVNDVPEVSRLEMLKQMHELWLHPNCNFVDYARWLKNEYNKEAH